MFVFSLISMVTYTFLLHNFGVQKKILLKKNCSEGKSDMAESVHKTVREYKF